MMDPSYNYCNNLHYSQISRMCTHCNQFICERCAFEHHYTHLDKVQDLHKLYYEQALHYQQHMNSLTQDIQQRQILATQSNTQHIITKVTQIVETSFIKVYKKIETFKEKLVNQIMDKYIQVGISTNQSTFILYLKKAKEIQNKIQQYVDALRHSVNTRHFVKNYKYMDHLKKVKLDQKVNDIILSHKVPTTLDDLKYLIVKPKIKRKDPLGFKIKVKMDFKKPDDSNNDDEAYKKMQEQIQLKKMKKKNRKELLAQKSIFPIGASLHYFDFGFPYEFHLFSLDQNKFEKTRMLNVGSMSRSLTRAFDSVMLNKNVFISGGNSTYHLDLNQERASILYKKQKKKPKQDSEDMSFIFLLDTSKNLSESENEDEIVYILTKKSDMLCYKINHTLVAMNEKSFYSIGGYSFGLTKNVEKYSFSKDQWKNKPFLNISKQLVGGTSFNQKHIFIFGGFTQKGLCNTIEKLPYHGMSWEIVKVITSDPIICTESSGLAQISAFQILIFGGNGEMQYCKESYILDILENTIKSTDELKNGDYFFQRKPIVDADEKKLQILGSWNQILHTFDIDSKKWSDLDLKSQEPLKNMNESSINLESTIEINH